MQPKVHERQSILKAMEEFNTLGRFGFLEKYGFKPARDYFIVHEGVWYDSKAIVGVAHGIDDQQSGPLTHSQFSGGDKALRRLIEALGFTFVRDNRQPLDTYILTWNAQKWNWQDYTSIVAQSMTGTPILEPWSTGNTKKIKAGSRLFLLRQGDQRGIIGAGFALSGVFQREHWDGSGRQANFAEVEWNQLIDDRALLDTEFLAEQVTEVDWRHMQASGVQVPRDAAMVIEQLWNQHLSQLGWSPGTYPEELAAHPAQRNYAEGAVKSVLVNRYERDATARNACLLAHGRDCGICGFNFGAFYGPLGEGFIHVHHLNEIALQGGEHKTNPIEDLIPVCPNCHAMLHKRKPALEPAALTEIINEMRKNRSGSN